VRPAELSGLLRFELLLLPLSTSWTSRALTRPTTLCALALSAYSTVHRRGESPRKDVWFLARVLWKSLLSALTHLTSKYLPMTAQHRMRQ
jgi:hypothetical protein